MNKFKKNWQIILIVLLVLFGMNKCVSSCSNKTMYEASEKSRIEQVDSLNNVIKTMNDSIVVLNTKIDVYQERVSGLNAALSIQDEANRRISEAKKNININVKRK